MRSSSHGCQATQVGHPLLQQGGSGLLLHRCQRANDVRRCCCPLEAATLLQSMRRLLGVVRACFGRALGNMHHSLSWHGAGIPLMGVRSMRAGAVTICACTARVARGLGSALRLPRGATISRVGRRTHVANVIPIHDSRHLRMCFVLRSGFHSLPGRRGRAGHPTSTAAFVQTFLEHARMRQLRMVAGGGWALRESALCFACFCTGSALRPCVMHPIPLRLVGLLAPLRANSGRCPFMAPPSGLCGVAPWASPAHWWVSWTSPLRECRRYSRCSWFVGSAPLGNRDVYSKH